VSVLEIPVTRTLARVLRSRLKPGGDTVQLVLAVGAAPPADANAYANVVLGGQTVTVPKLRQATQPAVGGPAYLLAGSDFLLYIGTVSST
jgi:hypothetical protein